MSVVVAAAAVILLGAVGVVEVLTWLVGDSRERENMNELIGACCNDAGMRPDGSLYVAKAELFRKDFDDHRPDVKIKWIQYLDNMENFISIPSLDYGMFWNGGSMSPFYGVFPASLADNVRYCTMAREHHQCLYLCLGLAMCIHPFLLMILFRHAAHHIITHKPVWRKAESLVFWDASWEEQAASLMGKAVLRDAGCLVFVVDMFPGLFSATTIAILSVSDGFHPKLSLINDNVLPAANGVERNVVVLFLHAGHYTCHPGDNEARKKFLDDLKLKMDAHILTPDGIDPIHRVSSETLFQRWFNANPPTPPGSSPAASPTDETNKTIEEFFRRTSLPCNLGETVELTLDEDDPVISVFDTNKREHKLLVRGVRLFGKDFSKFLTRVWVNIDFPRGLRRQLKNHETANTNASFAIHVATASAM